MTNPPAGPPPYGPRPPDGPGPGQPDQSGWSQPVPPPQQGGYPQQQGYPGQPGMPQGQPGYPGAPQPGYPGQPGPPPRKRRTGVIIGAAVVAVLLIVAAVAVGVVLTMQGRTPLSSDEQQVEAALREFYDTLSTDGFQAATELACKADRDEFTAMSESERSEAEKLEFSVEIQSIDNVVINGDHAEAQLTGKFSFSMPGESGDDQVDDSSEENLVKEDGEWRVCSSSGAEGT
ncbi:Rv0361 family membrane protein [Nocardia sp. NPDC003345]